jgi:hypothetical protein
MANDGDGDVVLTPGEVAQVRLANLFDGLLAGEVPDCITGPLIQWAAQTGGAEPPPEAVRAALRDALYFSGRAVEGEPGHGQVDVSAIATATLSEFLAVEREELRYYLPGLLPEQGKLLLTASAKVGKTFWAINLALCLAGGYCRWLGLDFDTPARVLLLQPELSDGLMAARLRWVLETAPRNMLNTEDAMRNLSLWQCDVSRPVLNNGCLATVEEVIEQQQPEVVICDPLYALFPGLVENAAEDMTRALDVLTGWTARFGCAVVLTHHHGKGGVSRGSSVLQGWPETDLSMAFLEDDRSHVRVDGLFRCTFGDDWPRYWQTPDRECAWFREPSGDWVSPTTTRQQVVQQKSVDVATILREAGGPGLAYAKLVKAIAEGVGCSEPTAKRRIKQAVEAGMIGLANGVYFAV